MNFFKTAAAGLIFGFFLLLSDTVSIEARSLESPLVPLPSVGRLMAGDSPFGVLGVLAAGYRWGEAQDGTGTETYLFSTFGTSDFINKDFGVTREESLSSGLPYTDLDGGYRSVGFNIIDRR